MSSGAFPLTEAQIIGLSVECICYGIYLVTFVFCMKVLVCVQRGQKYVMKKRDNIKWSMFVAACLMLIFTTFDIAFGLQHNLQAFVFYTGPGGAAQEFDEITNWVTVMKSVCYDVQTSIGDAVLIYRFYVVYGSRLKIVILPVILWVACLASWIGSIWAETNTAQDATLNASQIKAWLYATFALTLTLNASLTSLIVWKLWRVRARVAGIAVMGSDRLLRVVRIIVDSALIYTLSVFVLLAVNIAGSNALYPVSDMITQFIGITFNLIIIRSHNATESQESHVPHAKREGYRLSHIASTTFDASSFPVQRTDAEDATLGGQSVISAEGKDKLKAEGWTGHVLPVQDV